jgi:hypothetical protein
VVVFRRCGAIEAERYSEMLRKSIADTDFSLRSSDRPAEKPSQPIPNSGTP